MWGGTSNIEKQAKVSLTAVNEFELSVSSVQSYSPKLLKGIDCIYALIIYIDNLLGIINEKRSEIKNNIIVLERKVDDIESEIYELNNAIQTKESKISSLEDSLDDLSDETRKIIQDKIEDGIQDLEYDIDNLKSERSKLRNEINSIKSICNRLEQKSDQLMTISICLDKKRVECKQAKHDLEIIKEKWIKSSGIASDKLKRIKEIINEYLKVKMLFETESKKEKTTNNTNKTYNININIPNRNNLIQRPNKKAMEKSCLKANQYGLSEKDVIKHNVIFNDEGRIVEYDGKRFGGIYKTYEQRLSYTIDDQSRYGHYLGIRGESLFIPEPRTVEGVEILRILKKYGLKGISYKNAEPDFEECCEAVVKIKNMSENRNDYYNVSGDLQEGNFSQADNTLAEIWNSSKKGGRTDWSGRDVFSYRKANKLTWHEKCDTETMVLVRTEINAYFKHSGGVSECRERDNAHRFEGEFDE